jgi:peptide chain release factor subunit 1
MGMITHEEIRELAQFQTQEEQGCAISFYFQPSTPQDKSHRGEVILVKDLVRNALREIEKEGKNTGARADLNRILELAEHLHGNQARAKAIFASSKQNFWREFDLPPALPGTQLFVNRRFHLKPMAVLLGAQPKVAVVLVNRQRARFYDFRLEELKEREDLVHPMIRHNKSDGFGGYDAGHTERRVADEAMHHFKDVAARLKDEAEKGVWDKLIVGCPAETWPEFEPHLHNYVKQRILGRFSAEVTNAVNGNLREQAARVFRESLENRRRELVTEALDQAKANSLGVTGLRRVLRSLELGEVQTLLIGENFRARAVECMNCGHLDPHTVQSCPVCGHPTRELEDVSEALVPSAIDRDVELFYIKDNQEFDQAGNIAALLRFRVDQSKGGNVAMAS